MHSTDLNAFASVLAGAFDAYSRPAPLPETQKLWFGLLAEFSMEAVERAFGHYVATEPKFPPTPAQIREMLGAGKGDGRPAADEAWAIALASRDEADTVVWTPEIAEAFGACRPVLDTGDEVGARMAFKDAYARIIGAARLRNEPVQWVASIGFDPDRREAALRQAERTGLLAAPQVAALLPPPDTETTPAQAQAAREQIAKVKAMLAGVLAGRANAAEQRSQRRMACDSAQKAAVAAQVEQYQAGRVA